MNIADRLKAVGELRDGFLVIGAVVYALGYVVWSVVGWRHGLGPVPVVEAQYFVAGLPPTFLICCVIGVIAVARRILLFWWPKYVDSQSTLRVVLLTLSIVLVGILAAAILINLRWFTVRLGISIGSLFTLSASVLLFAALAIPSETISQRLSRWFVQKLPVRLVERLDVVQVDVTPIVVLSRWQRSLYIHGFPVIFGCLALLVYVNDVYVEVPQALGGARPRCAILDVKTADMSTGTIQLLAVEQSPQHSVTESAMVDVYFESDKALIIGVRNAGKQQIVELPREFVATIKWCERPP